MIPADHGRHEIGCVDVATVICEDLWQDGGPVSAVAAARAGLLLVINASPYERSRDDERLELCARRAREAECVLAYVNMVGGQDELVFNGDSLIVSADGELLAWATRFKEELLIADVELPPADAGAHPVDAGWATITVDRRVLPVAPKPPGARPAKPAVTPSLDKLAEVYAALVVAVRDYVRKNGFGSVILGLSGGADSALTATVAADALGPERVHAVLMPSRYSSEHSITDAEELIKRQGLQGTIVPIYDVIAAYEANMELTGVAAENLQARIRGNILMSLSNEHSHLVLTTCNKSEVAVGYSTLYGCTVGGYAPIKDVGKTVVWALARWRDDQIGVDSPFLHPFTLPPIPQSIIDKRPSAELHPGQLDTDSLPDYHVLDVLLDDYVERGMSREQLITVGHDPALVDPVTRMVDAAEHKRRQYPPGPKITKKNFGRGRRLPIASRWHESLPAAGRILRAM